MSEHASEPDRYISGIASVLFPIDPDVPSQVLGSLGADPEARYGEILTQMSIPDGSLAPYATLLERSLRVLRLPKDYEEDFAHGFAAGYLTFREQAAIFALEPPIIDAAKTMPFFEGLVGVKMYDYWNRRVDELDVSDEEFSNLIDSCCEDLNDIESFVFSYGAIMFNDVLYYGLTAANNN